MRPIAPALERILRALGWLFYWVGRRRAFASIPVGGVCAEIGVWKGDFSQRILEVLKPRELHLVDPWRFAPQFPRRWYGGAVARSQDDMDAIMARVTERFRAAPAVEIHRGGSTDIVGRFPDRHFDWIYIDGDHSTAAVLEDLRAWYPKLKSDGRLVLDDYYWRDESGRRSVKDAVDAFLAQARVGRTKTVAGQFLIGGQDGARGG